MLSYYFDVHLFISYEDHNFVVLLQRNITTKIIRNNIDQKPTQTNKIRR